ncbi:MAG: ATP-binding protein [Bacteroidia bacterium]|nr:ATP-binding protein [Bacteroidia bacterium]
MSNGLRILAVDSNLEVLTLFQNIFSETNHSILIANTVEKCSAILEHDKIDILILSTHLVDQQGLEFYRVLKISPALRTPFVILTSNSPFTAEFRAIALREELADGYMVGPYDELKVLALIHTIESVIIARSDLKSSISKSDNLVAALQDGVYVHELIYDQLGRAIDSRILEANVATEKHLNIRAEDVVGKLASSLFESYSPPFLGLYVKVVETGITAFFEQYYSPMDKYFNISVYSLEKGIFATVFSDITEHKLNAKVLLEREEKYRNLVKDMSVGVILQDPQAQIVLTNQKALDLLGLTEDQLLGKTSFDPDWNVIHEDGSPFPGDTHPVPQAIATGHSISGVIMGVYRPSIGDRIWLQVDAEVQRDKSGALWQVVCSFIDISKRKSAEAILEIKIEELAKAVAEKDKFFSIIAHDLRGPFNGFLGLTKVMAEEFKDLKISEIQVIATKISQSATNLYRLLNNLLEWSRNQRGMVQLKPEKLNLSTIVDSNLSLFTETAEAKAIEIATEIPAEFFVFADPHALHTILRNLLSNSLKFTPAGGQVKVTAKLEEDNRIEVSIQDSGIGMTQEYMDNLFRIDVDTKRQGTQGEQSTGLGLLLCKEFVEKQNGRIWVESEVGVGSTFYFTVPNSLSK